MGLGTCWGACPDMDEIQIFHDVLFVFFCVVCVADHRGALDI